MRIAFFGHQVWGDACLKELAKTQHKIAAVFCHDESQKSFNDVSIKKTAEQHGLQVYDVPLKQTNSSNIISILKEIKPELIVSVGWRDLLGAELLKIAPAINVHHALLPKYRGRACPNWALINDEKQTGVTVHMISLGKDAGNILVQKKIKIHDGDNVKTILDKMNLLFPKALVEAVELVGKGYAGKKQDESKATYGAERMPEHGMIDWNLPARKIYNLIRALAHPYPNAYTYCSGEKLLIAAAGIPKKQPKLHAVPGMVWKHSGKIFVKTGDGILELERVRQEEREIPAAEFFKNFTGRLGLDVERELTELKKKIEILEKRLKEEMR